MKKLFMILLANFINNCDCECIEEFLGTDYDAYGNGRPTAVEITCYEVNFPIDSAIIVDHPYPCRSCPQALIIQSSNSTTVASSSFLEYATTTSLYLENLEIENIAPGAFNALHNLNSLHLSGNFITRIGIGIFNSLFNLNKLDLSRNKIKVLDSQCLAGLRDMNFLNLSTNALAYFDDTILDPNIRKLDMLDLSSNELSKFEPGSLTSIIANFNISNNTLDRLYFCPSYMWRVDLSRNQIRSLKTPSCPNDFYELVELDLSYNDISDFDTDIFNGPCVLQSLSMHHNNITMIPTGFFSNLHDLRSLNLSHNKIQQFQHGVFESLGQLEILDVTFNNITDIRRYLHNLVNLKELRLSHNDLVSLDSKQLIGDLTNLTLVSIDDNNFTCDNLIDIIHDFRKVNVVIEFGDANKNSTNIHGISCLDSENLNTKFEEIIMNKLDQMSNQDFKKTAMYEYFNKDFKTSNFYEYMQNLQKLNDLKFNETQMFNYFDRDFENTKFFQYLEGMKDADKFRNDFNKSVYDYFNNDFKNSSFVKYLDELSGAQDILNGGFSKSNMYKFFNTNFENTQFYKYLESMRKNSLGNLGTKESQYEKLIDSSSKHDNSERNVLLPALTFVSLVIIIVILMFQTLVLYKKSIMNYNNKIEQVELIEA